MLYTVSDTAKSTSMSPTAVSGNVRVISDVSIPSWYVVDGCSILSNDEDIAFLIAI